LRPFTIVRVRGMVAVQSDQVAAREEGAFAFGMAVVTDDATAVGITAVPTPITDQASDVWFVLARGHYGSGSGSLEAGFTEIPIDSKAMRKVGIGQDIVQVAENGSAAFGCEFDTQLRILVKLH